MIISEIIEGAVGIWSKGKSGLVRRYRCTAGSRKGRIVSTPTTCNLSLIHISEPTRPY